MVYYSDTAVIGIASIDISSKLLATVSPVIPSGGGYFGRFMSPTQFFIVNLGFSFFTY